MNEDIDLGRYMIIIHGPPRGFMGNRHSYDTDKFGGGSVSVYRVLEGGVPGDSSSIRHITYAGGFVLREKEDKTNEEFVREIKEGLAKIASKK